MDCPNLRNLYVAFCVVCLSPLVSFAMENEDPSTIWDLSRLDKVGQHDTVVHGTPRIEEALEGDAIVFDGKGDGLVVKTHPLAGATQFTVEVIFRPTSDGPREQRFFHIQEDGPNQNRIMFETRIVGGTQWFLDTYIKSSDQECTLYAEDFLHPTDRWHHAAIVYDGKEMRHYVDGKKELSHELKYEPQGAGKTSLGMRLNQVYWFRGAIRNARFTARALPPSQFHLASAVSLEDGSVLPDQLDDTAKEDMTRAYLNRRVQQALDHRKEQYEELETQPQIERRQKRLQHFFFEQLGPLPDKTPLNPRVVGVLKRDGYRIEKIIYETRPKFYVTANLYLPDSKPPYPGVFVATGHIRHSKAAEMNQRICLLLAKNGMAALIYDPIGQGERVQMFSDDGTEARFNATVQHTLLGTGCILLGQNAATFRVWDGVRALDYLASREEVDANRIGCTGNSGGGMMTSYLMSIDPRVACAAPSCYITSSRRLLGTIGPQDAEQNIHAQVAGGLEHSDYLLMRAPKPTLVCCATQDFFDIQGTWDSFREAKRIYTRLGYAERVGIIESDTTHGFSPALRVGMVRWMSRWLQGKDLPITETECDVLTPGDLQCTSEGQVLRIQGARSSFDFNVEQEERLAERRRRYWRETDLEQTLAKVRRKAGIRPLSELPQPKIETVGTIQRTGYHVDKLVLRPEEGIWLPALAFVPDGDPSGKAYLYLHGDGKTLDAGPDGPITQRVRSGHLVLAVDLRGIGETSHPAESSGWSHHFGIQSDSATVAYLLDKTLLGMRAEDTLVSARFLANNESVDEVHVVSVGQTGPAVLHAVALEPDLFDSMTLHRSLNSWATVVRTQDSIGQMANVVHGALEWYDLPDLLATLPHDKVRVTEPVDARGEPVASESPH